MTLSVIYSMFEFTKLEQEKITSARAKFNEEEAAKQKDKKNLFGKMFKGKDKSGKNKSNTSFTSGGNSTQQSNR